MPGATNLKNSEVLESLVKKQAADGKLYAAICAAPAVALGSWGVLKGLKVSTLSLCYHFIFHFSYLQIFIVVPFFHLK